MVNVQRLKSKMQEKNISVEKASQALGMNSATFYRRIARNGENFTIDEVGKLADLLDMEWGTLLSIFFDRETA